MKFQHPLVLFCAALLLAGCGISLPGKLYSLQDGTELKFEIETSFGTGAMRAENPKTGEKFEGQYTGTTSGGGVINAHSRLNTGQTVNTQVFVPPSSANARGILRGDKGTVIEIYLDIRPGPRPKGHGEGIDNNGVRYQVQF